MAIDETDRPKRISVARRQIFIADLKLGLVKHMQTN
jgi:hypothetical protein